jgi:capsule polysaccharide export protein KpsE/RkpR
MTFKELQSVFETNFGGTYLSDIARELNVTPQVVSNWKARNKVPYKYVQVLRDKLDNLLEHKTNATVINPANSSLENYNRDDSTELDIVSILKFIYGVLRKQFKYVLIIPILIALISAIYVSYFVSPIFNSYATILPVGGDESNQLAGFANRLGLGSNSKGISDFSSSSLYPDFIKSKYIAEKMLKTRFVTLKSDTSLPLLKILTNRNLENDGSISEASMFYGRTKLNKLVKVSLSRKTPIVNIFVNAGEPILARDIALAFVDQLDEIQNKFKLDKIKEKRIFIENRIKEIKVDLIFKEETLRAFREKNRNINSSPALLLEEERLGRESAVLTQLYITLKNEFERIQIEEVEQNRMFVVLDSPSIPLKRSSPRRKDFVLFALIFSLLITTIVVLAIEWIKENSGMVKKMFI